MRVVFVVQSLQDGKFIGIRNGERAYFTNFKHAFRFMDFETAMSNAKDLDDDLDFVDIHPLIELN